MKERLAIIGAGISGLGAAYLLNEKYDITVYEKNNYIGGRARTKYINYDDLQIPVDTGFIVFNNRNYPHFSAMLEHLDTEIIPSEASLSAKIDRIEFAEGTLGKFFGQRRNLFRPALYKLLRDIKKFNKDSLNSIKKDSRETLGEFAAHMGYSEWFINYYLIPLGCAIWGAPPETIANYPAANFLKFFMRPAKEKPEWFSVMGGSAEYIKKLSAGFENKIRLNQTVKSVKRERDKIVVFEGNKKAEKFEHIIFACPANQALAMMENATERERKILSSFKYQENFAVLHNDPSFMPRRKRCWSSFGYDSAGSITYWINNLQSIDDEYPLFLTLNPARTPKGRVFDEHIFHQPVFNREAIFAQTLIPQIQGEGNFWYTGTYQRHGLHECGLASAVYVAKKLGVEIPW